MIIIIFFLIFKFGASDNIKIEIGDEIESTDSDIMLLNLLRFPTEQGTFADTLRSYKQGDVEEEKIKIILRDYCHGYCCGLYVGDDYLKPDCFGITKSVHGTVFLPYKDDILMIRFYPPKYVTTT